MSLTHLSLFSGIGGLDMAAEWAGIETIGQCEWAEYPTKVLEKHWPDVPRWKDIRTLTGESFYGRTGRRTVDIISGGFPCQPFSVAGKQRGKEDDRYLWPEMVRVIKELRPTWVVGENVAGIVRMALPDILSELEACGYRTRTFLVQLALLEPDTGDTELPLWATPTAQDYKRRGPNSRQQGLPEQVKLWPTPKASLRGDCPSERNRRSPDLSAAVNMFATPQARDYRAGQASRWEDKERRSRNLNDQIAMWLTPTTGAGMCGGTGNFQQLKRLKEQGVISENERRNMSQGNGGQLNPYWVEWLMGFPPGWTEI